MHADTDKSCAWDPLSKEQKARLSILAHEAFIRVTQLPHNSAALSAWRRDQAIKVCGRRISEAAQRDYLLIKAHFQDLKGDSGAALNTLLRSETEETRIALYKLRSECSRRRLSMAYPESICHRQYHCGLAQASPRQIWQLLYTVRSRKAVPFRPAKKSVKPAEADCPF